MNFRFVFSFLQNRSIWSWLLGLGAATCLLPFLALAAYCHPYLDDYSVPIALREEGFLPYVINMHFRHSGRFSSSVISVLHPFVTAGGVSLFLYRLYVGGLILLLGVSIWGAAYAVLGGGSLPHRVRFASGSLPLLCFFLWLPSPTEAFYWFVSGLAYTAPCILGLCLLAVISALQRPLPSALRGTLWLAGCWLFSRRLFRK